MVAYYMWYSKRPGDAIDTKLKLALHPSWPYNRQSYAGRTTPHSHLGLELSKWALFRVLRDAAGVLSQQRPRRALIAEDGLGGALRDVVVGNWKADEGEG